MLSATIDGLREVAQSAAAMLRDAMDGSETQADRDNLQRLEDAGAILDAAAADLQSGKPAGKKAAQKALQKAKDLMAGTAA